MSKLENDHNNQNSKYHQHITKSFFHVCTDKSVLEIGPNIGQQTYCIMNNNPRFVTQVEADEDNLPNLRSRFPHNNILHQDIFDYYKVPHKMDVVVCCGMFYHLHNPFHLLELIVNQSDPEYLVLDCTSADNASGWLKDSISLEDPTTGECKIRVRDEYTSAVLIDTEVTNTPGMRQSSMKKHMPFSIVFHTDLYRKALESFGYQTLKIEKIGTRFKTKTKHSSWMGLWKKT